MPRTLYLVDGHAQIYRAYYAPFAPLTSPTGEPTRAVHVFLQMILNLLRDRKPDYLAVAMDTADETVFRVEIDPEYKAHRQPPPEDLPPQIDRIVNLLEAMRIPILRMQGYEADDILATLCERHAGKDLDVWLVSRDKDLDQLIGDHVRLYDPGKDREIDAAAMLAEKGYGPGQAVEAQMLMGDSTDNVTGVVGVGPKKAAELLKKYGSVRAILDHAVELTPKLRENVLAFAPRMETVRQLVTLRRDVPIQFDLKDADVTRFEPAATRPILQQLGMVRMLERIAPGPTGEPSTKTDHARPVARESPVQKSTPAAVPTIGGLFDAVSTASVDPAAPSDADTRRAAGKYRLLDTREALEQFVRQLATVPCFAFDTETTGLNAADVDLVGMSFSFAAGEGAYVPVRGVGRTVEEADLKRLLGPVLADPRIKKCGQNIKYDLVVLKSLGLEVSGVDFDTMLASFVLDSSRRSHGLDALAVELLHYRPIATHELIGRGKNQLTFDQLPTDRVCEYAAEDADVAWRLRQVLEPQLTDPELRALFTELEMPLVEVLAEMEWRGVAIDATLLAEISRRMSERLALLEHEIHGHAGRPFNINSTQQLAEVLFDERRLPVIKRTKTARSTDAEVLESLAAQSDDPIPRLLLEYRELAKLKGTYVDALPALVSKRTGRIHPSFHQTGAVTGRLSCSDPNLQNIPIRTEAGAQIRRAFVAGEPGWVILKADYSQIELRVLAHLSGDEALRRAFREDRDIHAFVAAQLAGIPLDQVSSEQRARAKTVNFGIIYGQSAFGLARQTAMPVNEAKRFIEDYFNRYPAIRGFLDRCIAHARRHGYVKTMMGRRRAIPDIHSRNQTARNTAERLAVNSVVQGTAADMIKRAMINIHRRLLAEKRDCRMLIQVHDELVFETSEQCAEEDAAMISKEMSGAMPLEVPVKVDVGWASNWLEAK